MAMSFDASSLYTSDYFKSTTQTAQMESTLKSDKLSGASEEELMDVCKEFESYFVEQMFKAMKKMAPEEEESSAKEVEMFSDLMYQEMASAATKQQDYGIAQKLYEQMKRNYGLE